MHKGIFIADVHIGAVSIEETEQQLESYRAILDSIDHIDFIVIGGDLFDKQLYENDPYIIYAWKFLQITMSHAKKVRIVYGTSSHESMQYTLFEEILKLKKFDVKVIYTVSEEQLYDDVKVLYIPEEYIYDKNEYYKEYLSKEKEYQYVFGHGMIYEAFQGRIKPSKSTNDRRKAPTFSSGELSYCCNGDVLFGHYHVHTELEGNVSYVGSFYRWIQGEEEAKGLYLLSWNGKSHKNFIINQSAKKYITQIFDSNDSIFQTTEELETSCQRLLEIQEKEDIEKLKLIYKIPSRYADAERLMKYVKERFRSNKHIQVEFRNVESTESKKVMDELEDKDLELFHFITDPDVLEAEKISEFLKIKKDAEMKPETIQRYLDELE